MFVWNKCILYGKRMAQLYRAAFVYKIGGRNETFCTIVSSIYFCFRYGNVLVLFDHPGRAGAFGR